MSDGPEIRIEVRCFQCKYCYGTPYRVQGDSGTDYSCTHPDAPEKCFIGDSRTNTPKWCPFAGDIPRRVQEMIAKGDWR